QLVALLDEQHDRDDDGWIATHLDSCSTCQERLDDLTRSGPDSTCDLNPCRAVSANGPSTSLAPDPDSTCELNPSRAVSRSSPSTSIAPAPDSTCELNPSRAVSRSGPSTSPAPGPEVTAEFELDLTVSEEGLGRDDDRTTTQGRLPSTVAAPRARP